MLSTISVKKFNRLIVAFSRINANCQDLNALLVIILESALDICSAKAGRLALAGREKQKQIAIAISESKGLETGDGCRMYKKPLLSEKILAIPLRAGGKYIGAVELAGKTGGRSYSPEDLEWLEIFAGQAALAIVNARNLEAARSELQMLLKEAAPGTEGQPLVGKSKVMQDIIKVINRVAATESSVLILGESGVGKELVAEQIHFRSPRSHAPFVRVNCAALPEGLLESEMFGHVKGAFTSAVNSRRGRFEAADGGTIFLDEIGDLPLSLQAKLLRVIQEKTFEKVGSETTITVNTRILAATNKDIEAMVANGQFRGDLYYRLNVFPLYIPPLRQRTEDILELALYFLDKFKRSNKNYKGFSDSAIEAMLTYSWPGNIRELANSIERACVIATGKWISREDLFQQAGIEDMENGSRDLKKALNLFKANFIRKVLDEYAWNKTGAAKAMDVQRTYLSRLIKDLNIQEN